MPVWHSEGASVPRSAEASWRTCDKHSKAVGSFLPQAAGSQRQGNFTTLVRGWFNFEL